MNALSVIHMNEAGFFYEDTGTATAYGHLHSVDNSQVMEIFIEHTLHPGRRGKP